MLVRWQSKIKEHNADGPISHQHGQTIFAVGGLVNGKPLELNLPAQHLPKLKLIFDNQYPQSRR
jgi:hypothetical protein